MFVTQAQIHPRIFDKLCAEWIAQTALPPKFLDSTDLTAGEASVSALNRTQQEFEGLHTLWFASGVDFAIKVAAAVAGEPLGDPRPGIESAIREALLDIRNMRRTEAEDLAIVARRSNRRPKSS